ncbi:MAG TPA: hypothetical protein VF886_14270, partial [Roseiarcus sp.]
MSRVKGRLASEAPRPRPEAKAPPAKTPQRRSKPAAAKAGEAAREPAAPPRTAKDRALAHAPRRAERRSVSEIQTAPAPAEPLLSALAAPAEAKGSVPAIRAKPATGSPPAEASLASASAKLSGGGAPPLTPDVDALAHNISKAIEQGGKVLAAYLRPRQSGEIKTRIADDIGEMVRSIGRVVEYYM